MPLKGYLLRCQHEAGNAKITTILDGFQIRVPWCARGDPGGFIGKAENAIRTRV